MGLQYRKTKMKLSFMDEKPEHFKIRQLTYPAVSFEQLVAECSTACGVNAAQTRAVIDALVNRLVHYMEIGHGVQMGQFGSFKPVFTSKTAKTYDEADASTVTRKKVHFYPGKLFRQMLSDMTIASASEALNVADPDADTDPEPEPEP